MRYLNDEHIRQMGVPWDTLLERLQAVLASRINGQVTQPLKPYLRYGDRRNRIIAMPAHIGEPLHVSGLKWIASFPGNKSRGLPRAHSVTVLNEADTGRPVALCNSPLLSLIRTAAVTALALRELLRVRAGGAGSSSMQAAPRSAGSRPDSALDRPLNFFCFGWGPVAQLHARMIFELFGSRIGSYTVYDPAVVDLSLADPVCDSRLVAVNEWPRTYAAADVVLTCTVASGRHIDRPPKPGALLLHVSLRDYRVEALDQAAPAIIVDDWEEVCREDTDVERLHLQRGLRREQTIALDAAICNGQWGAAAGSGTVIFCPMGLAAFDLAIADWYVQEANRLGLGLKLPD